MKVLWCGDTPNVSTGFARCTRAACDALHSAGHEVHILGINEWGDPSAYHSPVYTCHQPFDGGRDSFGVTRLPLLIERLRPDVVVLLNDPWNVPDYLETLRGFREQRERQGIEQAPVPPIVGWLAVDAKNQRGDGLNDLAHVVTWTRFAEAELQAGGYMGPSSIVPLGVDHNLFTPRDQGVARARVFPTGSPALGGFVVGVVGRNQPRKRLDLSIAYFAEWVKSRRIDDAWLFLHVAPTGEMGCDVLSLVRYYELLGHVLYSRPHVGHGDRDTELPYLYSSFDVYLTTTQGEGWGLPALEAMACGVPCIVPDWSGLGDWTKDAAAKVPCTATALSAPTNGAPYTVGGVPDRLSMLSELDAMYRNPVHRRCHSERGIRLAATLSWEATGERMRQVLEEVVAGVATPQEATA